MLVVSSREFREKQRSYLDKVDAGMEILIQRGSTKSYKITPVSDDDISFSPEMEAKIERAKQQIENGECTVIRNKEELRHYFDSL